MDLSSSIIDNLDNNIGDVIKDTLTKSQQVQFAVGYLFLSGLKDIFAELQEMEHIQILIGNRTNTQTAKTLGQAFQQKNEEIQTPHEINLLKAETQQHYAHDIGTEFNQRSQDKDFLNGLYELIKSGRLEINIYTKGTFHAKAYIFTAKPGSIAKGRCLIGSSNLSQSGLYDNTELNVVVDGDANFQKMQAWFQRLRDESHEFTTELLETIEQSWIKAEPTPYEVYMKVLYELVGYIVDNEEQRGDYEIIKDLYQFQLDAVQQAVETVKKYNGVFVSDVVGLGKTYTWAAIMHILTQESSTKWLILCPAKLQEERRNVLGKYSINAEVASIDSLKKIGSKKRYNKIKYVLIDESHKFKDPNTQRYPLLQEFIHSTDKKLILLSATPLNLNGRDVYHQIKLFHKGETTELPITPWHLYQFFKKYEKGETQLSDVLAELMIRRTRLHIKKNYKQDLKRIWAFPTRVWPTPIQYDINEAYSWIYDEIEGTLGQRVDGLTQAERFELFDQLTDTERQSYAGKLKYAMYDKVKYIKDEYCELSTYGRKIPLDEEFEGIGRIGENLKSLARIMFYQRLESSPQAFIKTIDRIINYYKLYITNLENWFIFKTKHSKDLENYAWLFNDDDEDTEQYLDLSKESYTVSKFKSKEYLTDLNKDLTLLIALREKAEILVTAEDVKFKKLLAIINEHKDKKILIFSQYTDSTSYLMKQFAQANIERNVAEISGNTHQQVIELMWRFSPISQSYKIKKDEKEIDIAVATDIIAEWQNLQDAQVVINYDLHRNPVRLIQRIGRIDRIWSTNEQIYIYNFYPSETGEGKIGMRSKISERVEAIHQHIWEESKILSPDEELNVKMLLLAAKLKQWDAGALDEAEEVLENYQSLFSYSPYIQKLHDCKENHPEIYQKIKNMSLRMRTAKDGKNSYTLVFCKYGESEQCYILDKAGAITQNKKQFLELIECEIDTNKESLPKDHDKKTTTLEEAFISFTESFEQQTFFSSDARRTNDITAFRNKLQAYTDEILDPYDHEQIEKLETIIGFLNKWLETWHKKKFKEYKKIKKIEKFTPKMINEIYKIVNDLMHGKQTTEQHTEKEKYIIVSESIY